MKLFCSYTSKSTIRFQQRKEHPCAPKRQKVNHVLTLGAALGAASRVVAGSGKVGSGAPPVALAGSSSMITTGTMALFAAL